MQRLRDERSRGAPFPMGRTIDFLLRNIFETYVYTCHHSVSDPSTSVHVCFRSSSEKLPWHYNDVLYFRGQLRLWNKRIPTIRLRLRFDVPKKDVDDTDVVFTEIQFDAFPHCGNNPQLLIAFATVVNIVRFCSETYASAAVGPAQRAAGRRAVRADRPVSDQRPSDAFSATPRRATFPAGRAVHACHRPAGRGQRCIGGARKRRVCSLSDYNKLQYLQSSFFNRRAEHATLSGNCSTWSAWSAPR